MKRMWLLVGIGILVLGVGSLGADDVLVMGVTAEPETLDPHVTVDNNSWRAIYYCYDRLVEYEGGTTKLRPGLAESWEISDDGLTYTFHLRKGITFIKNPPSYGGVNEPLCFRIPPPSSRMAGLYSLHGVGKSLWETRARGLGSLGAVAVAPHQNVDGPRPHPDSHGGSARQPGPATLTPFSAFASNACPG